MKERKKKRKEKINIALCIACDHEEFSMWQRPHLQEEQHKTQRQ